MSESQPSNQIDIPKTVTAAYQKTWAERDYLLKMAIVPLLVKFLFYAIAFHYSDPGNILRLSILLVPAYFVEGWLLAHWVRTLIVGHRWPFRPSGDEDKDQKEIANRARGVLGGTVAFTLINLAIAGFFAMFLSQIPLDMDPNNPDPKAVMAGIAMMAVSFLLFRFVWLYIPVSVNIDLRVVLPKLKPLSLTFALIGVWLGCFILPIMMLYGFGGMLTAVGGENPIPVFEGLTLFVKVFFDTLKNVLVTAGLSYAYMQFLTIKIKQ